MDQKLCEKAARQEIIRRYFAYKSDLISNGKSASRVEELMKKSKISFSERPVIANARKTALNAKGYKGVHVGCALMLPNGEIVTGKNSPLMHAESAAILNALKKMADIPDHHDILRVEDIEQIRKLRLKLYAEQVENLDVHEILIVLAISARSDPDAQRAFDKLHRLHSCELHTTHMLFKEDVDALRGLGINFTSDGKIEAGRIYLG